jgi:hypothetical protein
MLEFYTENASILTVVIIIIITVAVLSRAFLGCWLAAKKGYSQVVWFYLCFFFGIFALLALGFVPLNANKKQAKVKRD